MLDVILYVLEQVGPARVSVFTWTLAEFEITTLIRLHNEGRILSGLLVIDASSRDKYAAILQQWRDAFGNDSIKFCVNHSKIATIEVPDGLRILVHGSFNLNKNPRLEQFQILESGPEFELVRKVESELPVLPFDCSNSEAYLATGLNDAFEASKLPMFQGLKEWKK